MHNLLPGAHMNEALKNISCELTKVAALLKRSQLKLHKRRQKPRLGTVSNTKDGGLSGANLVLNFYSGSKQGQEKCIC